MSTQSLKQNGPKLRPLAVAAVLGWMVSTAGSPVFAQSEPVGPAPLAPEVREVVTLTEAKVGDDVIISYIRSKQRVFSLSADDLVFLKGQGVSPAVINAMVQSAPVAPPPPEPVPAPAPAPAPVIPVAQAVPAAPVPAPAPAAAGAPAVAVVATPAPAVAAPTFASFHDQLAPYGAWVNLRGAWYWRPDAALRINPDFRPYYDMGRWVQTENGLYWQSDYVWGEVPFHYGRWIREPGFGWLWCPGYEWGPAWVFWRHAEADAAIGWAPLPVGAVVVDGGFLWRGVRVGLEYDFSFGADCFVFVGFDHFHDRFIRTFGHEYAWHIRGDRLHDFYRRSVVRNDFHRDAAGRFVNHGIGRERLDRATHGRMEHASFQERPAAVNHGGSGTAGARAGGSVTTAGSHGGSGGGGAFRPSGGKSH